MGRPLGSKNKPKTVVTILPKVIPVIKVVSQTVSQRLTDSKQSLQNTLQGTSEPLGATIDTKPYQSTPMINTPVVELPVATKNYTHTSSQIETIEQQTGLQHGGYFGDDFNCLVPVFFKTERTREEMLEKVVAMHHGRRV